MVLAAIGTLTSACGAADARPPGTNEPSNMIEYQPPPALVPEASVGGVRLDVVSYQWRINGQMVQSAPSSPTDLRVAVVKVPERDGLSFRLVTAVRPLMVEMRIFDHAGVPADDDEPQRFDCLYDGQCHVEVRDDVVSVTADPGLVEDAHMALLYVEFGTLEDADTQEGIGAYRASWIVKKISR